MRTKILLLVAILFSVVLVSNAQINKGKYLLGGSLNMSDLKDNQPTVSSKSNSFNANIQFGKTIKENTIVGIIVSYGSSNYYYPGSFSDTSKSVQYTAGIFYRTYKKLASKFYFFGEVNGVYIHSKNSAHFNQTEWKTVSNGGLIDFVPGISYEVCRNMHLELLMPNIISVSYSNIKIYEKVGASPPVGEPNGHSFSFNTNLNSNLLSNFGVGFKFFLGK
jgi:hypothetical protein